MVPLNIFWSIVIFFLYVSWPYIGLPPFWNVLVFLSDRNLPVRELIFTFPDTSGVEPGKF